MGLISVAGSSGRAIGPLVLARVYHEAGPLATYLLCIGLSAVGIVILFVFFTRLVPYSEHVKKKNKKLFVKLDNDDVNS